MCSSSTTPTLPIRATATFAGLAHLALTSVAGGQVTVVSVPQAAGSSQYTHAALSADGSMAVLATNTAPVRLTRWNSATNALVELAAPAPNIGLFANKIADNGNISGGWYQLASPFVRRGALWLPNGTLAIGPFGGSGTFGEPVASSTSGSPLFVTDFNQTALFEWPLGGGAISHGRPAGTAFVIARDGNASGSACVFDAITNTLGRRAYRWTAANGFAEIPLPDGATANRAVAISDDGSRVIGVFTHAGGEDGFLWSEATGVVPMRLPAGGTVDTLAASGDASIVAVRMQGSSGPASFVWTLFDGAMTSAAFATSRGFNPTGSIEFLDFNANGRIALARVGGATVLLRNLGRIQCGLTGDCFAAHATPGCNTPSCCESVCAADFYCCAFMWDVFCVESAEAICRTGLTCADPRRLAAGIPASFDIDTAVDPTASTEASCVDGDVHAVWCVYRAQNYGAVLVGLCTDATDGPVTLSAFNSCGDKIACVETGDGSCGFSGPELGFDVEQDNDYLIRISAVKGRVSGKITATPINICGAIAASCATPHTNIGCSEEACCVSVCAFDPLCCISMWDASCAATARAICYVAGDLDYNGHVDAGDLAGLLSNWGLPGNTDLDGNGTTGPEDLAELLSNWG